jgi:hypothetical protein
MTEERKHAILLATVILTARRLQPLLEEDDKEWPALESGQPSPIQPSKPFHQFLQTQAVFIAHCRES